MIIRVERGVLDPSSLRMCVDALHAGEIICYPTETFYALGVDPSNQQALLRLYLVKQRPLEKEVPMIASDITMVASFCDTSDSRFVTLAGRFWPGPLTMVLPALDRTKTYAIRVSSNAVARQLAQAFGLPVVSTSANLSGEPAVIDPQLLHQSIRQEIAVLVEAGPSPGGLPSTIVSLLETPGKVLREGAIPLSQFVSLL
jgi:L-threonylcarbamoyladenylate synthase